MSNAPRHPPLALRDMGDAAAAVHRAGGRMTAARRAVLEALFAAGALVSAEQIAGGLGGRVPSSDPASVYRNLEWLEEIGVVRHVHLGHGPGLYGLAGAADHEHLVCERCGRVTSLDARSLARARAEIRKATGYEAHFDHFPVHGLCPDCAGPAPRVRRSRPPGVPVPPGG
jgi:Fur family ferric uptake transcriptional regulator